jgi:hypothetical protein
MRGNPEYHYFILIYIISMDKNHIEQHKIGEKRLSGCCILLRTGTYQLRKEYCFSALKLYASLNTEHLNKKKSQAGR